jgi:glyoxylase-like metal-dependent hydrolase (beta-lactamase superfamily II)
MKMLKIKNACYIFHGSVNIGYIHEGHTGMIIDAGLDDGAAKKVVKKLEENGLPITHLFITHAHADHYGGASYIQNNYHVETMAPHFEDALLTYPELNASQFFHGNYHIADLDNKFLQGKPVKIDKVCKAGEVKLDELTFKAHHFPGHSPFQLGVEFDNVLYAADAYFGEEALRKHKIPFITHAEETLNTLNKLLQFDCEYAVPGHGMYEQKFKETLNKNITLHLRIYESVVAEVFEHKLISFEHLIATICKKWDIEIQGMMAYVLYRTAVSAYIMKAVDEGNIKFEYKDNMMYLRRKES